jgi:hypothetical protein
MNQRLNGIDPKAIVLDSDGRFELNDRQLMAITGGQKKKTIVVIVGSKCKRQGDPGKYISGGKCHN